VRRLVVLLLAACASSTPAPTTTLPAPEPRVRTAGNDLAAFLPANPDILVELDLARLRRNEVVGPLLEELSEKRVDVGLGFDIVREVDVVLLAVYRFGMDDAGTLILLHGAGFDARAAKVPDARPLDDHTLVVGPELPDGAAHEGFETLRDEAMPDRAPGAALRITAQLTPRARVAGAGRIGIDELPASLSVWGDVADDLAVVAVIHLDDEAGAVRNTDAVRTLVRQAARLSGLPLDEHVKIEKSGASLRVVLVIPPRTLSNWVRLFLGGQS
jgi:hypothetical protein